MRRSWVSNSSSVRMPAVLSSPSSRSWASKSLGGVATGAFSWTRTPAMLPGLIASRPPNDFDETLPGPWEWDVERLAASFEIARAACPRQATMPAERSG